MTIWLQSEIDWLIENYPKIGKMGCASYLNRSSHCIRSKASRLGLKQDKESDFFKNWQCRAAKSKIGKKRPEQALVMKRNHELGKLLKTEEQKLQVGIRTKLYIQKNGHPKGFLGGTHTEEAKKKIAEANVRAWENIESKRNSASYRQYLSDRMSIQQAINPRMRNGYSRGKIGKRADLDNRYFRSSWEANYARYLNLLIKNKQLFKWEYEPDTFWFHEIKRGTRSYTPDFKIWETEDSEPYYIEIKGWMDQKSTTKHKRMAKYYAKVKILMIKKNEYLQMQRKLKGLIPYWE